MKYRIKCIDCGTVIDNFYQWYEMGQSCPNCSSIISDIEYSAGRDELLQAIKTHGLDPKGIWRYFDFLPLEDTTNQITAGEGNVVLERWPFLEEHARKSGIELEVYAHRHDNNPATGTFKDLAGAVIGSVLKEIGLKSYVVATTGNIGVALSRYLSDAGVSLHVFLPENSSIMNEAEVGCFGQKVFRVQGDYATAKNMASEFSKLYQIPLSPNSYDPIRIEAKKTIAFEWRRQLKKFPTVYIQGLSGGTGPLGIAKGCRQLKEMGFVDEMPRFMLVQSDCCDPMSQAWADARNKSFPSEWLNNYPIIDDPQTRIPTLATGNPLLYPYVAMLVKETDGEIFSFKEHITPMVARLVAYETAVRIGPAAAIAVGGFFNALKNGCLINGDRIVIAIGEGIRRSPDFMQQVLYNSQKVSSLGQCRPVDRSSLKSRLWADVLDM